MRTLSILLAILLSACGAPDTTYSGTPSTASWIQKTDTTIDTHLENTPVIFQGKMYYVSCDRDLPTHGVNVFDENAVMVTHYETSMQLCSAIVDNDTLYVFGSRGRTIVMASTTDLVNWNTQTVLNAPYTLYNSSVAKDATGYVMAYENCENVCTFSLARSKDLIHWQNAGDWHDYHYTACPTIRYVGGYYYVMFLGEFDSGNYATLIARSSDLYTWQTSPQAVVSPLDGLDATLNSGNTSDLDFVEINGKVLIEYQNFSQHNVVINGTGTRLASFDGTMEQFLSKFF